MELLGQRCLCLCGAGNWTQGLLYRQPPYHSQSTWDFNIKNPCWYFKAKSMTIFRCNAMYWEMSMTLWSFCKSSKKTLSRDTMRAWEGLWLPDSRRARLPGLQSPGQINPCSRDSSRFHFTIKVRLMLFISHIPPRAPQGFMVVGTSGWTYLRAGAWLSNI